MRFIHGMELREMPCFRGLADGQSYFVELMKYIFTYLQNVIGNLPMSCDCLTSCERNAKQ
jgi:hypothetical protein